MLVLSFMLSAVYYRAWCAYRVCSVIMMCMLAHHTVDLLLRHLTLYADIMAVERVLMSWLPCVAADIVLYIMAMLAVCCSACCLATMDVLIHFCCAAG